MNKKIHFVCLLNKCFIDNVKTAHWVGHSQLKSLDTDYFFKTTPVVDDIQASVTGNTMKQSASEKRGIQIYYKKKKNKKLKRLMMILM